MIEGFKALVEGRLALLPFAMTIEELLVRDAPGRLQRPDLTSANGACRLLRAADGWLALNLARGEDRELIPALTGLEGEPWENAAAIAKAMPGTEFVARAAELQLPVARLGEAMPLTMSAAGDRVEGLSVVDLSVLWAGPLCASLLAKAGARVTRIENSARLDPTPRASPVLDHRLNSGKMRITLDMRSARGSAQLHERLIAADVIVTSARPNALAALQIDDRLLARRRPLIWVAITAHGWAVDRVGFGDDCAVAGGLVRWERDGPRFLGDALADPLSGLEAALAVLEQVGTDRPGRIDVAMARVAATYAASVS